MRKNTFYLLIIIGLSTLFNACTKEEDDGMDFKINGLKNLALYPTDSIDRTVTVLYLGGKHEEVHFSVAGLPSGTSIKFSPNSGTADFSCTQTIITNQTDTGSYSITVTATAESGKSFSRTFVLQVSAKPNISPTLNLNGPSSIDIVLNSTYSEPGATAIDPEDGNLNSSVVISGTVNADSVGVYTISYVVYDSGGLKDSVTRAVHVLNSLNYLSGQYTCMTVTGLDTTHWTTTIQAGVTVNNTLKVFKIGDSYLADPIITFDPANSTFVLPMQWFYCLTPTDTSVHSFSGIAGSLTQVGQSNKIQLDYSDVYTDTLGVLQNITRRDIYVK